MTPIRLTRRGALLVAGSASVAAALRSMRIEAQTRTVPRRIVLFFTPHGTVFDRWRPTTSAAGLALSYILAPLERFKTRLSILDGMGLPAGGPGAPHTRGPAVLFTGSPLADDGTFRRDDCSGGCSFGWNVSHSVDQEIARRLQMRPETSTPYPSLEFGVSSGGGFPGAHIIYAAPARPLPPKQDPYVAFQQLFSSRLESAAQQARDLARRQAVLTAVNADLTALRPRVSRADMTRLQSHTDAIAELRRALEAGAAACTVPTAPEHRTESDPNFRPWAIDRQIELLTSSLACGLTRVASLQFRPGENDGGIYTWLSQTRQHHLTTHEDTDAGRAMIADIYRWYAGRFAYLLERLDSFPEADGGTLLDHTLVVWGSEIGDGRSHDIRNVPFVVAGGGRAGIRMGGQHLRLTNTTNHRLLVTLLHYMGFTDVNRFGTLDMGSGPLTGLLA